MNYQELARLAPTQRWAGTLKAEYDAENALILAQRMAAHHKLTGPQCGDWLDFPDRQTRISHNWEEDGVQTTCGDGDKGDFYLCAGGGCSFSGSLDPIISLDRIRPTDEMRAGRVWFFSLNQSQAHNGVTYFTPFRVWKVV